MEFSPTKRKVYSKPGGFQRIDFWNLKPNIFKYTQSETLKNLLSLAKQMSKSLLIMQFNRIRIML